MSGRPKIFGHLLTEVIRKGECVGCGTCAAVCPVDAIELESGTPKLVGMCIACGMCYGDCPKAAFDEDEMDNLLFGRSRTAEEAEIGVHMNVYTVQAKDKATLEHCQDGGAVSAILIQFLSDGGEGAVVAALDEGNVWVPRPAVASNKEEILESAGTKYTPSPTMLGVDSAVTEYKMEKIAVVGTPCQMRGLSKATTKPFVEGKMSEAVHLKVGLFCMETFNYDSLMEFLKQEGVDASKVDKFEIKSGKFIANEGGKAVYEAKLSKVKNLVRPCCHECGDFSSEYADLSVGNVGTPDGWSTVIVRTKRGEEALRAAEKAGLVEVKPVEEGKAGMDLVYRLARSKKKQLKKEE